MTVREVIYLFRHFIVDRSRSESDDQFWSDYALYKYLIMARASIVKELIDSGKTIPEQMNQTIGCFKLEEADMKPCPEAPNSGCTWLCSKDLLPPTLKLTSVTAGIVGSTRKFDHKSWSNITYLKDKPLGDIYTTKDTGDGTRLYLYGETGLKSLSIEGIYTDPSEALSACDEDCGCEILDSKFYIENEMQERLFLRAWEVLPFLRSRAATDLINDDKSQNG